MKTIALILSTSAVILCLTAFNSKSSDKTDSKRVSNNFVHSFKGEPELTFFYDCGPRFQGITKGEIANATSIVDLFKEDQIQDIVSYGKVSLIIIENEAQSETQEYSQGTELSEAQINLLKSLDYSDNFNLRAICQRYNEETDETEESFHSPHLTIVPEQQTTYVDGKNALLNYLAEGSLEEKTTALGMKLRPAMLYFTVTKKGKISNVKIGNHSGYQDLDNKMIQLIKNLPGEWKVAENGSGERVDQELVVSYGFEGC